MRLSACAAVVALLLLLAACTATTTGARQPTATTLAAAAASTAGPSSSSTLNSKTWLSPSATVKPPSTASASTTLTSVSGTGRSSSPASTLGPRTGPLPNAGQVTPVSTAEITDAAISNDTTAVKSICNRLFGATADVDAYFSFNGNGALFDSTSPTAGDEIECLWAVADNGVGTYVSTKPTEYPTAPLRPFNGDPSLEAASLAGHDVSMQVVSAKGALTASEANTWLANAVDIVDSEATVASSDYPVPTVHSTTTEASAPVTFSMTCSAGDSGPDVEYANFEEAWKANPAVTYCDVDKVDDRHGTVVTATEHKALVTAYGDASDSYDGLAVLSGVCGEVAGYYAQPGHVLSEAQAKEAAGALVLCPKNPAAATIKKNINIATGKAPVPADSTGQAVYSVTGADSADITYDAGSGTEQVSEQPLPWSKQIAVADTDGILTIVAQNNGGGSITCSIAIAGKVVAKHTSTGDYAVVTCADDEN